MREEIEEYNSFLEEQVRIKNKTDNNQFVIYKTKCSLCEGTGEHNGEKCFLCDENGEIGVLSVTGIVKNNFQ